MCKIFLAVLSLALFASLDGGAAMLVAARASFAIAHARRWQNPYVIDGLVAMWDGEWNAGPGLHDANAAAWRDLVGSRDLVKHGNFIFVGWTEKSAIVPVLSSNYVSLVASGGLSTATLTVEICHGMFVGNNSGLVVFGAANESSTACGLAYRYASNANTVYASGTSAQTSLGAYYTSPTSMAFCKSGSTINCYAKGLLKNTYTVSFSSRDSVTNIYLLSNNRTSDFARTRPSGPIYCVRIYSRALTADEIAANYAIDKARFGL